MSPSVDLTASGGEADGISASALLVIGLSAAAVVLLAYIFLRDTQGEGTPAKGGRTAA